MDIKNRYKPKKELESIGYEIIDELGEGSYGMVFKVKK